jgi:hypothetical protein
MRCYLTQGRAFAAGRSVDIGHRLSLLDGDVVLFIAVADPGVALRGAKSSAESATMEAP